MSQPLLWIGFTAFVLGVLALDLGVFHRKAHAVGVREAAIWSIVWVTLAAIFGVGVYFTMGTQSALEFAAGYLVEEALSVDNLFVFLLLFSYFRVPAELQHRVLFWGILGALVMRAIMIVAGAALIHQFHWIIYVFGAILIVTGIRMAVKQDETFDAESNPVMKLARRRIPLTNRYDGQKFFTIENGKKVATPLFLVLLMVEFTDLVFAIDSIPAIFAVTRDPFIVYTSNVFAILGLRSMYFLLAHVVHKFVYLKYGLAVILTFVGVKMVLIDVFHVPIWVSLGVILLTLIVSIAASLIWPNDDAHAPVATEGKTGSIFGTAPPGTKVPGAGEAP